MEIRPAVHTFDLPWGWDEVEEPLSVHVLETDEAMVLLGTGDESTADDLVPIAREHDVDVVVAEHGDIDHYGGIPFLQDALDVTVAIPAGDAQFLEADDVSYDEGLEAGETYWGIETIAVPGHTPDNMAYLYDDVLVAGDTVCGSDSAFAMDGDWPGALAPLTEAFNHDTDEMLASIPRLRDYDVETLVTSHGQNVLEDAAAEVDLLVDAITDR